MTQEYFYKVLSNLAKANFETCKITNIDTFPLIDSILLVKIHNGVTGTKLIKFISDIYQTFNNMVDITISSNYWEDIVTVNCDKVEECLEIRVYLK